MVMGVMNRLYVQLFYHQFCILVVLVVVQCFTNAPTTFNEMISKILLPNRDFVGTFFDDIIVFSQLEEDHKEHLAMCLRNSKKTAW